jgi:hypothetical protein
MNLQCQKYKIIAEHIGKIQPQLRVVHYFNQYSGSFINVIYPSCM